MIKLRNVSKTVMSGSENLTIVQPLDLAVEAGDYVSIVGIVRKIAQNQSATASQNSTVCASLA